MSGSEIGMLETSEERVKLLKAGISAKDIERLYIIYNEFKMVIATSFLNLTFLSFFTR